MTEPVIPHSAVNPHAGAKPAKPKNTKKVPDSVYKQKRKERIPRKIGEGKVIQEENGELDKQMEGQIQEKNTKKQKIQITHSMKNITQEKQAARKMQKIHKNLHTK